MTGRIAFLIEQYSFPNMRAEPGGPQIMIPRLTDIPSPSPLHAAFLAELRARGFAGDLSAGYADRTVLATDNSI